MTFRVPDFFSLQLKSIFFRCLPPFPSAFRVLFPTGAAAVRHGEQEPRCFYVSFFWFPFCLLLCVIMARMDFGSPIVVGRNGGSIGIVIVE